MSSVSNGLYLLTLPLVSVMLVIYRKIRHARYLYIKMNEEKVWGARYLSKNTVFLNQHFVSIHGVPIPVTGRTHRKFIGFVRGRLQTSMDTYLLTYLLTPWCRVLLEKLTGLQLVKKFPAFLWNPKFHYRTHKRPPPVPVLGQPNPVYIPTSHLLKIHPNIIHPSTPRSPQWSLSLRFPHQEPIRPPLLTHTRHVPSPSHSSRKSHN